MKTQSNKLYRNVLFMLGCIVALGACNANQQNKQEASSVSSPDTLLIWADSSLRTVVDEQVKAFSNIYTEPILSVRYYDEAYILDGLLNNKINCTILHRQLTEKESAYMRSKEDFTPKQYIFAYDAFVFVSSRARGDSIMDMSKLKSYFRDQKSAGFQLAVENTNCQSIQFLRHNMNLSREQLSMIYAKNGLNDLMDHLRSNPQTIGVIPFSYISDLQANSTLQLLENLKVMQVTYMDSTQKNRTVQPSQGSIAAREYPLISPLVLINGNMDKKSGTNFVNYIFKTQAQRLILRCGLCPAIFPGREVNIKTN